jgi:hypothetical protein
MFTLYGFFPSAFSIKNKYVSNTTDPAAYFFSFQFYRFEEVTTEKLLAFTEDSRQRSNPAILKRVDENNIVLPQGANGFMVKMIVDKASLSAGDADDFTQYLARSSLHIDVWSADSLMHVGTASMPLKVS